jgi:hypothetical protein
MGQETTDVSASLLMAKTILSARLVGSVFIATVIRSDA